MLTNTQKSYAGHTDREFDFTEDDYSSLAALVKKHAGIYLPEDKEQLVYSRLCSRLRQLKLSSFSQYRSLLGTGDSDEFSYFINAITTNLTAFFREEHHFDYLAETLIPELMVTNVTNKKIRIWSAGCSTGQEAYSMAMVLRETISNISEWDVKILATDLDTNVLEKGRLGIYPLASFKGVSKKRVNRWFKKGQGNNEGFVRISSELRDMVQFNTLNLMAKWPMKAEFDAIFCRNVAIYFDKPTQDKLATRFFYQLRGGGHLFIGHSESLHTAADRFSLIGNTIYKKSDSHVRLAKPEVINQVDHASL